MSVGRVTENKHFVKRNQFTDIFITFFVLGLRNLPNMFRPKFVLQSSLSKFIYGSSLATT